MLSFFVAVGQFAAGVVNGSPLVAAGDPPADALGDVGAVLCAVVLPDVVGVGLAVFVPLELHALTATNAIVLSAAPAAMYRLGRRAMWALSI